MECPKEADSITRLPPPLPLAEDVRMLRVPRLEATPPSVLDLGNYRTVYFSSFVPSEDLAAMAVDTVLGEHKMRATVRKILKQKKSKKHY